MFKYIFGGIPVLMLLGGLACPAWANDQPTAPREGVLVLHGGQVLQGKIRRVDDLYHVTIPGGEIRVRATRVAIQAASIEDAYRQRRAAISVGDADHHIELARWCQRNHLFSAAARELADAMAANPDHPWIPHLERRLKVALSPPKPATAPKPPTTSNVPSADELDRMVRQMPKGTVETFTSSIQPLLLSSCTTGGCHTARTAERFQLLRGRAGRGPTRRVTQRNLHSTLAMIDRKQPGESPLLIEAARAHGNAEAPALGPKSAQRLRQIAIWVYQVAAADNNHAPAPTTTEPGHPLIGQPAPNKRPAVMAATWPEETLRAAAAQSPAGAGQSPTTGVNAPARPQDHPNVQRGAKLNTFVPADPFDPEIFNRRYHPVAEQPSAEKAE